MFRVKIAKPPLTSNRENTPLCEGIGSGSFFVKSMCDVINEIDNQEFDSIWSIILK